MVSITSIATQFDPATMHPASILPVKEMAVLAGRIAEDTYTADEMHPASLPLAERLVTDGYGELILRVKNADGTLRPVTKEEYAKSYRIFQKYAPRLEEDPKPLEKSRIQMMREELQAINPNMVATFIPRSLFELIFMKKALEEDVELEKRPYSSIYWGLTDNLRENSWCYYGTKDTKPVLIQKMSDVEKHLPQLLDVGYRLNQVAIEEINQLGKYIEDLSYSQIEKLLDAQIKVLEKFQHTGLGRLVASDQVHLIGGHDIFGKGLEFGKRADHAAITKFLKKVLFLESHESSIGKIILYRGGNVVADSPFKFGTAYSISLGISLFAGIFKDAFACAYTYMRERDAFAFVLDPGKESFREIRVLPLTAIEALFGSGEMWHCRFMCSKEEIEDPKSLYAMTGVVVEGVGFESGMSLSEKYKLLKNNLSRQWTIEKFKDLKERNLFLFHHKNTFEKV